MGFTDILSSVGDTALQGLKDVVGANQKAIIEIADFSNTKVTVANAARPTAGNGQFNKALSSGFDLSIMDKYAKKLKKFGEGAGGSFEQYRGFKKYRFECQFNPEEISISGYGGEEVPTQKFTKAGPKDPEERKEEKKGSHEKRGSHMDSADPHIDMHFKLVFDKTNIQDAFYSDKFTLSATNIGKGIGTAVQKVRGKSYSVQPEVEALTAVVRDNNKRLARFVWGDMVYEGVINSINAEYVMFNVNGEPCRAFVNISMVLYDKEVTNNLIWRDMYMKEIYSIKHGGIVPDLPAAVPDVDIDFSSSLTDMFG